MKKIVIASFVILSSLAFGQSVDDLVRLGTAAANAAQAKGEKDKLSKATAKYNADQPSVSLAGQSVEVRPPKEEWSGWDKDQRRWLKTSLGQPLTALGARPVWSTDEIECESDERNALESNRWVNQKSVPRKGTIEVAAFTLEFDFIELEKSSDLEVFMGRWWKSNSLRMSRETAYCGLIVTLRNRHSGEIGAVYKTMGTASSSDNVGGEISSFFGSSLGFSARGNSEEDRQVRARENALKQMGIVIKQKCR